MNPFSFVDDVVYQQLAGYTPLTGLDPAPRIMRMDRNFEIRNLFTSSDMQPQIAVLPGNTPEFNFTDATSDDDVLLYEIWINSPGKNLEQLRDMQWQCKRAFAYLQDWRDTNDDLLNNPEPLLWAGSPRLTEFAVQNRVTGEDGQIRSVLRSVASLEIRLAGEHSLIESGTPAAPVPVSATWYASSQVLVILFDKRLQPVSFPPALSICISTAFNVTGGVVIDRSVIVAAENDLIPCSPHNRVSYSDTPSLIGVNGVEVAEFLSFPITVV